MKVSLPHSDVHSRTHVKVNHPQWDFGTVYDDHATVADLNVPAGVNEDDVEVVATFWSQANKAVSDPMVVKHAIVRKPEPVVEPKAEPVVEPIAEIEAPVIEPVVECNDEPQERLDHLVIEPVAKAPEQLQESKPWESNKKPTHPHKSSHLRR